MKPLILSTLVRRTGVDRDEAVVRSDIALLSIATMRIAFVLARWLNRTSDEIEPTQTVT